MAAAAPDSWGLSEPMSVPTASQSTLVGYASPVGGGIGGVLLPPPQATTIDDKQHSVIHVLRDMTFPIKLIQQGHLSLIRVD